MLITLKTLLLLLLSEKTLTMLLSEETLMTLLSEIKLMTLLSEMSMLMMMPSKKPPLKRKPMIGEPPFMPALLKTERKTTTPFGQRVKKLMTLLSEIKLMTLLSEIKLMMMLLLLSEISAKLPLLLKVL